MEGGQIYLHEKTGGGQGRVQTQLISIKNHYLGEGLGGAC